MDTNITYEQLEIKHVGLAIECGTLDVLLRTLVLQPVLLMPLTRTVQQGNVIARQWCVHLTSRPSTTSPVSYATFRAAEVVTQRMGSTLTAPYPQPLFQRNGEDVVLLAMRLQASLVSCLHLLLTRDSRVTTVLVPARYRLPDEWVWSARGADPRLFCEQAGMWSLISDADTQSAD
jgi:hypothetical protein